MNDITNEINRLSSIRNVSLAANRLSILLKRIDTFRQLSVVAVKGDLSQTFLLDSLEYLLMKKYIRERTVEKVTFLLGWIGSNRCVNILEKGVGSSRAIVRRYCVFTLGQISEKKSARLLIRSMKDRSDNVRRMASTVVGWAGGDFHIPILKEEKVISNDKLRIEVQSLLSQLGSNEALRELAEIVK